MLPPALAFRRSSFSADMSADFRHQKCTASKVALVIAVLAKIDLLKCQESGASVVPDHSDLLRPSFGNVAVPKYKLNPILD
jgi:hypothetical protein